MANSMMFSDFPFTLHRNLCIVGEVFSENCLIKVARCSYHENSAQESRTKPVNRVTIFTRKLIIIPLYYENRNKEEL